MKCAYCKQQPKNRCDKDGHDCTGGKLNLEAYNIDENKPFHRISGTLQHLHGNNLTRLQELLNFCEMIGYKKIGLAFCVGLAAEAGDFQQILENKGFKVESACCKICGLDKKEFEVEYAKADKEFECLCNPLGQAEVLNKAETDINVEFGLCVGHDMLFHKYSKAPVTAFCVKDRVLAHNPLGVLYSSYLRKKYGLKQSK